MTVINLPSAWLPIADAIVKATIVLTLAAAASIALRRASAALRHLVWMLALGSALLLPVLSFALPKWQLPLFTVADHASVSRVDPSADEDVRAMSRARTPTRQSESPAVLEPAPLPSSATIAAVAAPARSWPPTVTWQQAVAGVWLAGALLILARIAVGLIAIQFLSRRTQEITEAAWLSMARTMAAELGISPRLRFLRSGRAAMPVAAGIFRPVVIMPSDAEAWTETRLRLVLLHELAHVKRRDCLTHLLAQAACAFYWFNPLAWLAVRRARTERERACDDLVLASGTPGADYADQLIDMARVLRGGRFPALLAGASLAMAHRSQLEGRLMAILDPRVPRAGVSRSRAFAAIALCFVAVTSLGALQPWTDGTSVSVVAAAPVEPRTSGAPSPTLNDVRSAVSAAPKVAANGALNAAGTPASTAIRADAQPAQPAQVLQPMLPGQLAQSPQPTPMPQPMPMPVPPEAWVAQIGRDAGRIAVENIDSRAIAEAVAEAMEMANSSAERGRGQGRASQADPRLVAALTAALKDSDKEVRETAMQALVQMRDPSIFEPLVQALKDTSPDVREHAAHGLGQLRDKRAVQPLIAVLKEDTSAGVREQALHALGLFRDPAAFEGFVAALRDANPGVREQAVHALGQLRDKRAIEPLMAALKDSSASVREQVVHALGQFRDPAAFEGFVAALRDTNPSVREQAAHALSQLKDKRAVEPLISALKDSNASVREQAAFALGQLRDPAAVEALIVAIKDANPSVREQVVFALGQIRDPRAIDALTGALKDTSADVRQQAAFALGQLAR